MQHRGGILKSVTLREPISLIDPFGTFDWFGLFFGFTGFEPIVTVMPPPETPEVSFQGATSSNFLSQNEKTVQVWRHSSDPIARVLEDE